MRRLTAGLVALVAGANFFAPAPAAADAGNVNKLQDLDGKFTALVEQIPGMHLIDAKITDNGGRKVCAYLNTHNRKDTDDALRQDNPTFTPAEADAFVDDATEVYCRRWIRQVIA